MHIKTKKLRTKNEYEQARQRIYTFIDKDINNIEHTSAAGQELEHLSTLVEKFEREHYN